MSWIAPRPSLCWPALGLAIALGLTGCSGSEGSAQARESASGGTTPAVASANDKGGCPLTVDQVSAAFGAQAAGGSTAGDTSMACSFFFSLDGRSMVLTGVPLDRTSLERLARINTEKGAKSAPITPFGSGAFSYTRSDPTSETGLAYTASATFSDGSREKHWVYKFAVLLPIQEPGYDLRPLLGKLEALVESLPSGSPLSPAKTRNR